MVLFTVASSLLVMWGCDASLSLPTFTIERFGGKADAATNNAIAIKKAIAACDAAGGCSLVFGEKGTYLTSAFNLTSNLKLQIEKGVVLQSTESNADNCGAPTRKDGHLGTCSGETSPWPVLPWLAYPSVPNSRVAPSLQGWIRSYNATNIEITGGGVINGGGPWWWCTRFRTFLEQYPGNPKIEHWAQALSGCADAIKDGKVPSLGSIGAPHMIHIVESRHIHIHNVTIEFSPMWTVHFQYSSDILFENNYVFNPNNATFETPNGDGIDMNSCRNAVVRNNVIDVGDDALCVKSGMDLLGRRAGGCNAAGACIGRPTENILWTDNEVRNGHGLTIGSDASGGVRNITFRNIFLNGLGGPQAPGKRGAVVGGPHFKTQRGRGGVWEDITWDNIYGVYTGGISFFENYGGNPAQDPPTNASATPEIRNLTVKNVVLSCLGPSIIYTLAESPIENLILRNITLTSARHGARIGWQCPAAQGTKQVDKLFAAGATENVTPLLGLCSYSKLANADASFYV